jgi:hypothetical protein
VVSTGSLTARIVLEPAEVVALQGALPVGMRAGSPAVEVDAEARARLRARDVIDGEGNVHRSVLAGLVLLADPAAVHLSVVAAGPAIVRRTSIALSEHLLAGWTTEEPSGRAEQFLARTEDVAAELVRLLPDLGLDSDPARTGLHDVDPALLMLAVERVTSSSPVGLSWDDLGLGADLGLDLGSEAVRELAAGFAGSLSVTLSVPAGLIADAEVLDRLLWVASAGGWWSLRPRADRHGDPRLDVEPVMPDALGRELAPMLAAAVLALGAGE